jgi:DNA-directed RNA polymerase subunit RPC12/RpoP
MKLKRALELMRKYSKCPKCGSEMIGNEAGTLEIDDDAFRRTCKCGWTVVVKAKGDGNDAN